MNESLTGILLEAVKTASGHSRLIDDLELTALCSENVSDEIEITNAEVRETLKTLHSTAESPVTVCSGRERLRCYDSTIMSASYAEALNLSSEGYNLETIAETVRKESRVYPRPCITDSFLGSPYNMDPQELEDAVRVLVSDNAEFSDICLAAASNGDVYLYSDRYMNKPRAEYLAEWESVGSLECQ